MKYNGRKSEIERGHSTTTSSYNAGKKRDTISTGVKDSSTLLIDLYNHLLQLRNTGKQENIVANYQHFLRLLDSINIETEQTRIESILVLLVESMAGLKNSVEAQEVYSLQVQVIKIIKEYKEFRSTLKLLYKSNAELLKISITDKESDTDNMLDSISYSAKALKLSDESEKQAQVLNIDRDISRYTFQISNNICNVIFNIYKLRCEKLIEVLEHDTLKTGSKDAPKLFKEALNQYRKIVEEIKSNILQSKSENLIENFFAKAGSIIDVYKDRLKKQNTRNSVEEKCYQYELKDLNKISNYTTQLLLESRKIPLSTHKLPWQEHLNELENIRKAVGLIQSPLDKQKHLSEGMTNIFKQIIEESEKIIGKPPCDYAILGFGSISRFEGFPYSDLECLLVLDKPQSNRESQPGIYETYFRTLFKLIDIQMKALGEQDEGFFLDGQNPSTFYDRFTIDINYLEDRYNQARGTPDDGLKYCLLKPSLIYGSIFEGDTRSKSLFERYEEKMSQILSIHKEQAINQLGEHITGQLSLSKQLSSAIAPSNTGDNLSNRSINLKENYYSPLVYLAIDLGLYYNIKSNNTLDIYEELNKKGVISGKFLQSLKEAYTYIVELRIEAHNFKKAHNDELYLPNSNKSDHFTLEEDAFEKLKRINIEVITPLYKTMELIVKDRLSSSRDKISKKQEDMSSGVDYVANTYYKAHSKNKEVSDNPSILAELISIYSRHAIRQYSLEKAQQSEAKYLREGIDSIIIPLPSKLPKDAIIVEEAGVRERRMLKPEVAEMLLGQDGSFKEKEQSEYGRRNVRGINYQGYKLHFKENPELPGMEYALGSLIREVTGQGAPITSLLKFSVGNKVYPVQVSRTVKGINLQDALNEGAERLEKISSRSFGLLCIASLLINPEDGKPDNYILEPVKESDNEFNYNVVCVDNDHGLVPALAREKMRTKVMVKTILYCMKQMHENIDKEAREQILTLNYAELLDKWLKELIRIDDEYRNLFTVKEHAQLLNQGETKGIKSRIRKYEKEGASPVIMPIPIKQGAIAKLYQKFQQLKYLLEHNEEITPMQLLYIIEPLLAKYYDDPRLKGLGAKQIFNDLFVEQYSTVMAGRFGTMINSRQLLQSVLQELPNLEDIMNKKHTPAEAIDELKIIKLQSTTLSKLREELIAGNNKPFKELKLDVFRERVINGNKGEGKGVDFTELDEKKQLFILQVMRGTSFTELSLAGSTVLTDFLLEGILKSSPGLSVLNVSGCMNLSSSAVRSIARYCPLIEKLIISNIPTLSYIGTATGIGSLAFNNLRRLDLSNNISLNNIKIRAPKLQWLNLNNCEQASDKALSALISKCPNLNLLKLEGCKNISNIEVKVLYPQFTAGLQAIIEGSKETINFSDIKLDKEGLKILNTLLKPNTAIKALDFRESNIDTKSMIWLAALTFKINRTITTLNLGYNDINHEGIRVLEAALKANTTVTNLDFISDSRYYKELGLIKSYLGRNKLLLNDPLLTTLEFRANNIGNEGAVLVANVLKTNTTTTKLDFTGNNISAEGGKAIAEVLKINTTIKELILEWNQIGDEGVEEIAEALKTNTTLTYLNLENNCISVEGGKVIAEARKTNTTLTYLNLENNFETFTPITYLNLQNLCKGNEGKKVIAETLKTNTALTSIILATNDLDYEGIKALIENLKTNNILTSLDLKSNNISDEGAREIAKILEKNGTLTFLDLASNNIGDEGAREIAKMLEKNATLTSLNLGSNNIGEEGGKAIADALKTNTTLTYLNLKSNQIGIELIGKVESYLVRNKISLSMCYFDFDLREKGIGDEGIKIISQVFKTSTTPTHLNLKKNKISAEGMKILAEALKTNNTLKSLNLANNNIGAEGAGEIAKMLEKSTALTSLDLEDNNIGAEGIKILVEVLKTNNTLESLNLANNNISIEGLKTIADALKTNNTLTSLNLNNNNIGKEGGKFIIGTLEKNTTLISLIFESNSIGARELEIIKGYLVRNILFLSRATSFDLKYKNIGAEGLKVIAGALKTNTVLTSLNLENNNIGEEGGKTVADILKTNTTLTSLDLNNNNIGEEGGKAIIGTLERNTALTSLSLGNNNIGEEGGKTVADILKTNTTLTSLDLNNNNIGEEGGKSLISTLEKNTTLISLTLESNSIGARELEIIKGYLVRNILLLPGTTSLDLKYKDIGDVGLKVAATALKTNTTLTSLNLKCNSLTNKGGKTIADILKSNTTLTSLNLDSNNISVEGGKVIAKALQINATLTSLNLDRNNMSNEVGKTIIEALKTNTIIIKLSLWDNNIEEKTFYEIVKYLERNKAKKEAEKHILGIGTENKSELKNTIESVIVPTTVSKLELEASKEEKIIIIPTQLLRSTENPQTTEINREVITSSVTYSSSEKEITIKSAWHPVQNSQGIHKSGLATNTTSTWNYARREDVKREGIVGANRVASPQQLRPLPNIGTVQPVRKSLNVERRSTLLEYNASKSSSVLNKPELCEAAKLNKVIMVTTLLRDGANHNYTDEEQGRSALHYATEFGHIRIVELLLNHSVPVQVNLSDKVRGDTALHIAADKNHLAIAKMLLDKEVDINICNHVGFTPLHYAVSGGYKDLVNLLLAHGADTTIRNKEGRVALDYAQSFEMKEIFRQSGLDRGVSRGL